MIKRLTAYFVLIAFSLFLSNASAQENLKINDLKKQCQSATNTLENLNSEVLALKSQGMFTVSGQIMDRDENSISLYGLAIPVNGNMSNLGTLTIESNIVVEHPNSFGMLAVGQNYAGQHHFLRKEYGLNALGSKVPVWIYGMPPANPEIDKYNALLANAREKKAKICDEYKTTRLRYISQRFNNYQCGNGMDCGEISISNLSSLDKCNLGKKSKFSVDDHVVLWEELHGSWLRQGIVIDQEDDINSISYILKPEILKTYFSKFNGDFDNFPEEWDSLDLKNREKIISQGLEICSFNAKNAIDRLGVNKICSLNSKDLMSPGKVAIWNCIASSTGDVQSLKFKTFETKVFPPIISRQQIDTLEEKGIIKAKQSHDIISELTALHIIIDGKDYCLLALSDSNKYEIMSITVSKSTTGRIMQKCIPSINSVDLDPLNAK